MHAVSDVVLCRFRANHCFLNTKGENFEEFNHTRSSRALMTPILTDHCVVFDLTTLTAQYFLLCPVAVRQQTLLFVAEAR